MLFITSFTGALILGSIWGCLTAKLEVNHILTPTPEDDVVTYIATDCARNSIGAVLGWVLATSLFGAESVGVLGAMMGGALKICFEGWYLNRNRKK